MTQEYFVIRAKDEEEATSRVHLYLRDSGAEGGGREIELADSLKVVRHSPTGFEFGYGGSGPSQLALAILLDAVTTLQGPVVAARYAEKHHQAFKEEFIASQGGDSLRIPVSVVRRWMVEIAAEARR